MSDCQCQKCNWKSGDNVITAEQARKKSNSVNGILASAILNRIFSRISLATERGQRTVQYTVGGEEDSLMPVIVKHLQSLGYGAKHNKGYDQRDNDSWNTLNITW